MVYDFLTLDDVDVAGKTVFLRADINIPIDPSSKRILDAARIRAVAVTLKDLKGARVVLGSHQSRPGRYDFTSLELHARVLQMYHQGEVKYVDDVIGAEALSAIKSLEPGEVLVLNNLRMLEEENRRAPAEELERTELVQTLSPFFDLTVNDAFAAAHRSQASLVGFSTVMPMVAGRLMERELAALNNVLENPDRPCVYLLGGAKVDDRLPVIRRVLRDGIADRILIGGLIRECFHMAKDYQSKRQWILGDEERKLVDEAAEIMDEFGDMIDLPVDVALDVNGERVEVLADRLTDETNVYDIGLNTIAFFSDRIKWAGTVVAEGPLGMFERRGFDIGTKELLRAMARCDGYTVVGGGHMGGMTSMLDIDKQMSHVSTGGGAMLALLAGEKLPVVEALAAAKARYG